MNEEGTRWRNAGLVALIPIALILYLALMAALSDLLDWATGLVTLVVAGIGLLALLLIAAALWPGFERQARGHLEDSPGKAFLVGLVNYVFLGAIGVVLLNLGPIALVGVGLVGVLLVGTLLGLPAVATLVGERLHGLRERAATPWSEIVVGGVALELAILIPIVGWFVVLPALCLWSFGAAALALAGRRQGESVD